MEEEKQMQCVPLKSDPVDCNGEKIHQAILIGTEHSTGSLIVMAQKRIVELMNDAKDIAADLQAVGIKPEFPMPVPAPIIPILPPSIPKMKAGASPDIHSQQQKAITECSELSEELKEKLLSEYNRLRRNHPEWKAHKTARKAAEKFNVEITWKK